MISPSNADAAKLAAVRQWTQDPCGPETTALPGTPAYAQQLVIGRRSYAPWFAEALDYRGAAGLTVLDVGCGQGIDAVEYAWAGAEVTGLDLTPRHVELARQNLESLNLTATIVEGDAEKLPFADGSFDRVSSNGVLHHTPDVTEALREIHRVLKPNGEARILLYNRNSFHYLIHQILWRGVVHRQLLHERSMSGVLSRNVERSSTGARPLVRVYSPRQVRELMRDAGFSSVRTSIGGFNVGDTPITGFLAAHTHLMDAASTRDRIGRIGGWYVLGFGRRHYARSVP